MLADISLFESLCGNNNPVNVFNVSDNRLEEAIKDIAKTAFDMCGCEIKNEDDLAEVTSTISGLVYDYIDNVFFDEELAKKINEENRFGTGTTFYGLMPDEIGGKTQAEIAKAGLDDYFDEHFLDIISEYERLYYDMMYDMEEL